MIRTMVDDGTDVVLIDRPTKRNALTSEMWHDLAVAVEQLDHVDTDAPIVVRGSGDYFSAGADLAALATARSGVVRAEQFTAAVVGALLALHRARRRTVALVDTGAAGGGVEIMLACDARLVTGAVTLVFPFGGHGVSLDEFTAWRLGGLVGDETAARLTSGVQRISGETAVALGLVDGSVAGPGEAAVFPRNARPGEPWPGLAEGPVAAAQRAAGPMLASLLV